MSDPNVHDYLDFRAFLRDWFDARCRVDPTFSKRKFARLAGRSSPGLFAEVVDGGRRIVPDTARAFARAMGLSRTEADFFDALVRFGQASDPVDRRNAWERILSARRFHASRPVEGQSYAYLSCWWIPVVRELAGRPDFVAEPAWIASHLRPQITESQARQALETLHDLGMLVPDEHGVPRPADGVLTTPHEVQGMAVHEYHKGMLRLASEAIDRFEPQERHLLGATVSIPTRLVEVLKSELDHLQERILALCNVEEPPDQVLQVELVIFPVSDKAPPC